MEKIKDICIKRRPHRTDREGKITLDFTLHPLETERNIREARGDYVTGDEILSEKPIKFTMVFDSKSDLFRFPDVLPETPFKRHIISECAEIASSSGKPGKHKYTSDTAFRIKKDSRWLYCFFKYWEQYWPDKRDIIPKYVHQIFKEVKLTKRIWNSEYSIMLTQYCLSKYYPGYNKIFAQKPSIFRRTYIDPDKSQLFNPQEYKEIWVTYFENASPEAVKNYPSLIFHTDSALNPLNKLLASFILPSQ